MGEHARRLLTSIIPAQFAYIARDGTTPRGSARCAPTRWMPSGLGGVTG